MPFPLSIVVDNTEHRRTATQFMSENLLDIFQYGIRMLHRLHDNDPAFADPSYRRSVMTATLDILSHCLQFDFTGCTGEEGSDEVVGAAAADELGRPRVSQHAAVHVFRPVSHRFPL